MAEYLNRAQFGSQPFTWDPTTRTWSGGMQETSPGYLTTLLQYQDLVRSGQAKEYEAEQYRNWEAAARAIPTRDIASLRAGWQGESQGGWRGSEGGWEEGNPQWWSLLDPGSPDAGPIMLQLRDKVMHGQATPQEQQLYQQVFSMAQDWDYRASVPQASDANPFGMGDNLMGALMMLGMGASGGAAAGALAAGGLTLASASGLAGAAGGLTGMMGEALDEDVLRKMGISLGAVGGATGLASLASSGIHTVGDLLSAVQKGYGVGSKVYGLATGAGSTPDAPRQVGSASQSLSAAESRTAGRTTSGGTQVAEQAAQNTNPLGAILAGLVGGVGSVLSLADVSRYMSQLKDKFKDEQGQQDLIDQAYELALARYETYYARNEQEYTQKQEAYTRALERYDTRYTQQQENWDQQQQQFAKIEGQTDQDRATQYQNYQQNRQKVDESYARQVQEAREERDYQVSRDSANVAKYDAAFQRQVQEVEQDRAKEYQVFDQQYAKYQQNFDRREAQAVEERGLDLNAYQQRQSIGRNLSDPAALKAGAEALYQPLSALARDRVNTQTEEEMARRGVAGGGQFSNLMAAKAFAPQEQQLWTNALNAYLQGQTGALTAYGQQDMTMSPAYTMVNTPNFTNSPGYQAITAPNLEGSPGYTAYNTPSFTQSSRFNVPSAPGYEQVPSVPQYQTPGGVPTARGTAPTPYAPFGSTPATGTGAVNDIASLVNTLAKAGLPQALIGQVAKMLGIGQGDVSDKWLAGGDWASTSPVGDSSSLAGRAVAGLGLGDEYWTGSSGGYTDADLTNFDVGSWEDYVDW